MAHGTSARTTLRLLAGAALSATALLAAGVVGPVAAGASASGFSRAVKVSAPANANYDPGAALYGVSCPSPGDCTAVGRYSDSSDRQQALAAAETGGKWTRGTELSSPANASQNPNAVLHGVSCTSPGDCTAVGGYSASSNHQQALAAAETGGKWARGTELSSPANASLKAVSCTSAGNCVAVGSYEGLEHALAATESGGKWGGAVGVSLPANAATGSMAFGFLQAVSCTKGSCTAVGLYGGTSGNRYAMVVTETGGKWGRAVEFALLPSGASNTWADLLGVSCTSAASCTAVGSYMTSSDETWPMVATETGGMWARAAESSLPLGANTSSGGPSAELDTVSCTSAGHCAAFGAYNDSSYYAHDMVATETGGKWARAAQLLPPSGATFESIVLGGAGNGVACAKDSCTAVGGYGHSSGNDQAMAAAGTI
jgi:hypothetical protein